MFVLSKPTELHKPMRNCRLRREVGEICAVLSFYAACTGNCLPTFSGQPIGTIFKGQEIQQEILDNRSRWERQVVPKLR